MPFGFTVSTSVCTSYIIYSRLKVMIKNHRVPNKLLMNNIHYLKYYRIYAVIGEKNSVSLNEENTYYTHERGCKYFMFQIFFMFFKYKMKTEIMAHKLCLKFIF